MIITIGWLALDIQDAEILGWPLIEHNSTMRMARGEAFLIYMKGM
jgi:hypothetical protein